MIDRPQGIVIELQRDCLNPAISASAMLRKARVIAFKLDLSELSEWIDSELNGYTGKLMDLPVHRQAGGSAKFWNPYNGWCPIVASDETIASILSKAYFSQPIAQLEEWINSDTKQLTYKYPQVVQQLLQEISDFEFEAVMHVSSSQIVSALEFVRNKLLDWTLELEKLGIVGEGFTFDDVQKKEAVVVTNHVYGGNVGVLGAVAGDANNSGFMSAGRDVSGMEMLNLVKQLREANAALPDLVRDKFLVIVDQLENAAGANPVDQSKAQKALSSMKTVLEGAAGNLAASGILAAIAAFQ